jgi:hypothetical protein
VKPNSLSEKLNNRSSFPSDFEKLRLEILGNYKLFWPKEFLLLTGELAELMRML